MNITIIAVGKIKEKYFTMGIAEYLKRLQAYAKIEVIEVKEESFNEPLSDKQIAMIQTKEAEHILAQIPERYYQVVLDLHGKQLASEELAQVLSDQAIYQQGKVAFIIGGSLGLSKQVIAQADLLLSFSKFTFPHQLMRLILVEQIYRGLTIIRGEKYHK